uniref:Uncharacterized protein n=1 Tax=Meloidogyne hapla TaxID=6305 RepID=A0A1I8BKV8_MELHA
MPTVVDVVDAAALGPCCCGCGGGGGGYGRKKRSVVDLMAKKFSDILLPQFNQDAFIPMGCGQSSLTPLHSLCSKIPPMQRGPACQKLIAQQPQFPLSQNIFNQQQQMMGGGGTMAAGIDSLGNNGEMSDCQCSGACNNNNNGQIPLMNSQSQQFGGCNQQQCNANFANAADAINCQQQQMSGLNGQSNGCNNGACPQSTNGACMGDGNNNNNFYNLPSFGGGVMMDSSSNNNNIPEGSAMHSTIQNSNNMLSNVGGSMPCSGSDAAERGIGRVGRGLERGDLLGNIGGTSIFDAGRKKRFLVLLKKKALNEDLNNKSNEGYEKGF